MPDYTISQVVQAGVPYEFPKGSGQMLVPYTLTLRDEAQPVVLNQKQDREPPKEGDVVPGNIDESGSPRKLRREYSQNGPQGGSKGSSDNFDRRPDHPQTQQRMRHTTALSAAPAYIEQMLTVGVVPQPKTKDDYVELVQGVMTWLEGTYPASSASE